jgi:hypothetical protein
MMMNLSLESVMGWESASVLLDDLAGEPDAGA